MRLPNGYGSVVKLSGKRRKPFMARVTSGKRYDEEKKDFVYDRMVIGYYAKRSEALQALSDYQDSPFTTQDNTATFGDLWEEYKKNNYKNLSKSSITNKDCYYKYCKPLEDIRVRDITINMLDHIIDSCEKGSASKKAIKSVMSSVFQLALRKNLVPKDLSLEINIEYSEPTYERVPFDTKEINILWDNSDRWDVRVLLILLYSGMRVNEFLKNDLANVDLEARTIYVPKELAKNYSSIRTIPIHDKTFPFIEHFYNTAVANGKSKIAVNDNGTVIPYNNFVARNLPRINKLMDTPHKFHDTRHTFVTRASQLDLKEIIIQKIIGHAPSSIMKKVYTHVTIEEMAAEINKIIY